MNYYAEWVEIYLLLCYPAANRLAGHADFF
jgi:hypothetical protein